MDTKYLCVVLLFVGLCHGVSEASDCTARGRFPNDGNGAGDCRGYTICLMGGLTNFTQYKLNCPEGFVYSHLEYQCTNATNYQCYPTFNCSSVGNFAVPGSSDCSAFIACPEGLLGINTARKVSCPPHTLFNVTAGACQNSSEFSCTPKVQLDVLELHDKGNNGAKISPHFLCSVLLLLPVYLK
ncbi:hypothetical protein SFRURICE_000903 [Spodoptera frugiperda]|uniref:SFRICE_025355 n=1 Tax=Spodoptera frugiperda TaxID=7108 RepID=A0A2H1VHF3_SPOFR|nr:hypothetical protein SFRURICE_010239 [Spodoptera frugiperda]KAF9822834.1 hypothetical protein SFRURICE_000903 [Spodoptera frugiperda]